MIFYKWILVFALEIIVCIGIFFSGVWYKSLNHPVKKLPNYAAIVNASAWATVQYTNNGCQFIHGPTNIEVKEIMNHVDMVMEQTCKIKNGDIVIKSFIRATSNPFVSPIGHIISVSKLNIN